MNLLTVDFFAVNYTWQDLTLGELAGSTVVPACDGRAACEHLKIRNPHLTRVWLAEPAEQQHSTFDIQRSTRKEGKP